MYVSGFTFIRNAIKYDYPIVEAIQSLLPLCDEIVVAVGNSDDETLALIENIGSDKIKLLHTIWDDTKRAHGEVLAIETNKALAAVNPKADWCLYLQGDECLHEDYIPVVQTAMEQNLHNAGVDGLLFNYKHFYGSYDYIGTARRWYRQEIRVVRNRKDIYSYKDAQGFRKGDNKKLNVKRIAAEIFHYGWVRPPEVMQAKDLNFNKMYHSDDWIATHKQPEVATFDYSAVDSVARFTGTHPKAIQARIARINWTFEKDPSQQNLSLKEKIMNAVEAITGWRPGEYKNFIEIK